MKNFLLGFIAGIFLAGCVYFFFHDNPIWRVRLGQALDTDVIYLMDGTLLRGNITSENEEKILVEIEDGYFTLPRSRCVSIKKNVLSRYLRELI